MPNCSSCSTPGAAASGASVPRPLSTLGRSCVYVLNARGAESDERFFWLRRGDPGCDELLRPADPSGTVPAQEAEVPAARHDVRLHVGGGFQRLEGFDGDERVVAGGEDQC